MLVSIGRNPYVELRRLVQDVVPFDHDTDKNFPHNVRHTCIRDARMREAILRVDRRGLL